MIYIVLLFHFGFNVFFTMCFAAFIFAWTQSKFIEKMSILFLSVYSILELAGAAYLLAEGNSLAVWYIWIFAVVVSLIISLILYLNKKLDITMWGPFCIIFGPLIIIPVLAYVIFSNRFE